ncbi:MAG: hypothetical protein V4582_20485 [Pseudomonadota bacterium]
MNLYRHPQFALLAAVALLHGSAFAQEAAARSTAPAATSPAYQSAFSDYRSLRDEPPVPWRVTNDLVANVPGLGGQAGHSMENSHQKAAPTPTPSKGSPTPSNQVPAPASKAAAKPDPHAGHKQKE